MTRAARLAVAAACVLIVIEAASLVSRGGRGLSDVSVYYRTSHLLRDGVGPDIYLRHDAAGPTWLISMPPIGYAIFQPFSLLGPAAASGAWAAFTLILLAIAVVALRRVVRRAGSPHLALAFPWAIALLLVLAAGSVQVGQFSVLFVTCWILFMDAFVEGRHDRSALWLAIPAAIKLYPVVLVAVPLSMMRTWTAAARYLFVFVAGLVVLSLAVPAIAYGSQTWALNLSWWQHVVFNDTHFAYQRSLRAITNQSLDTVLLRYLSYDPSFHNLYGVPHLSLTKEVVLRLAHVARAAIAAVTTIVVWRWRGTRQAYSARDVMMLAALWSSALYLMLPEAKSRYAVYTFVAFLPWIEQLAADGTRSTRIAQWAAMGTVVALVVVLLPDTPQAWGVGFIGSLALWAGIMRRVTGEASPGSA